MTTPAPRPGERQLHHERLHRERLRLVWWLWPFGFGLAALLAAAVHSGYGGLRSWLPYVVAGLLTAAVLALLNRTLVEVANGRLLVNGSILPLPLVAAVRVLDRDQLAVLVRTGRHPDGYHVLRGWIGGAVQVRVDDPADCTPYWLVSSRHPEHLADAIAQGRALVTDAPD